MSEQITIQEFRNNLRSVKSELLQRIEKVLKLSALRMEGRSKQRDFSRFNNDTGRLRQSIAGNFGIEQGKPVAMLQAGGQFGGANVDYAEYIEFGTSYIRPRLFLGRSVEAEKEQLTPDIRKLITAILLGKKDAGQ